MKKDIISIAMAADDKYSPYLATTIKSILENGSCEREYCVWVLHTSISSQNQKSIKKMTEEYTNGKVCFINLKEKIENKNFYVGGKEGLTIETYFRLFIPDVLKSIEKVLYLDCDMIVEKDIGVIYDTDLGDNYFASVQDYCALGKYYMKESAQKYYWDNVLKLDYPERYFCAGMVLMNLKALRDSNITSTYLINKALEREWEKHDQDVLNIIGNGMTLMLPITWDVLKSFDEIEYLPNRILDQIKYAEENPCIIHFSSSYKPWNTFVDRYNYFWKYAVKTPYIDELLDRIDNSVYKDHVIRTFISDCKIGLLHVKNDVIVYETNRNRYIGKLSDCYSKIFKFSIRDNLLSVFGKTMFIGIEDLENIDIFMEVNGQEIKCEKIIANVYNEQQGDIVKYYGIGFKGVVKIEENEVKVKIGCFYRGHRIIKKRLSFGKFANLTTIYKNSYYNDDKYIITTNGDALIVKRNDKRKVIQAEIKLLKELLETRKKYAYKAVAARLAYHALTKVVKKEIWLFSDRANKADDNGEALFNYVNNLNDKNIQAYFIISKKCKDYTRIKNVGNVVESLSFKHKVLYLLAKYNISSQADNNVILPFFERTPAYCDLIKSKFIFLQHGVIKEDMSSTYNLVNQNMSIFVTAANEEYKSIVSNMNYACDETVTKLTGLPRHDKLVSESGKYITFMPTWRRYLFTHDPEIPGVWIPKDNFVNSEYFAFYNSILNDSRLIETAQKRGYKIAFMAHPNVQGALKYFNKNKYVEFFTLENSYSDIFSKSAMVVTDRSSAIMDFAYLRKPLIYCHFDDEVFMSGRHVYVKGYFDYVRDGFGEVEYTLEDTIDRIIEYMNNECKLKEIYRKRMDNFFAFNDKNNCQRVYEKIMELQE